MTNIGGFSNNDKHAMNSEEIQRGRLEVSNNDILRVDSNSPLRVDSKNALKNFNCDNLML